MPCIGLTRNRCAEHDVPAAFLQPHKALAPARPSGPTLCPVYGAFLVDEAGNTTVKSDATKQALEWFKKLVPHLPESVFAWDNSQNNKHLISGQGSLIMNPPSA